MPIDIELSELSAGGQLEPKAEWTIKATKAFTTAIRDTLKKKNAELIVAKIPTQDPGKSPYLLSINETQRCGGSNGDGPSLQYAIKSSHKKWRVGLEFGSGRSSTPGGLPSRLCTVY